MNILVCIKQVPGTNKVEVDEKTGVLKREGVDSKMNPYDLYAIETALWIGEKTGGKVTALTMGPPQAEAVIREAYMMGVADVLATGYTLSMGIRAVGEFDLILCGKQTTDGDTGQVGPALAEYLGIPHVSWVKRIEKVDGKGIVAEQDMADSTAVVKLSFPCLITVDKDIMQPRLPSYRKKLAAKGKPVGILTFQDFADRNESNYGLSGSATKVERIFPPESNTDRVIRKDTAAALTEQIFGILQGIKAI